ncbi:MAG: hypothetical protein JOY54_10960 [Acidobacteriaceae bacterium]|nr:hypothetical protein [Acidobacteriaceae bacterium]
MEGLTVAVAANRRVFRVAQFFRVAEEARWPLWMLAIAVLALIAVRIALQSITIDEADTYVYWVSGKFAKIWQPNANNHLLNSYLIWVSTHLFGLNNFSMRLPSFLGALLYVSAAYRFCMSFAARLSLRLPLYGCFLLNPFLLDFFVAARGYGLALGFFTTAVVMMCQLIVEHGISRRSVSIRFALVSSSLALSFVSSFSFAFACTVSFALFLAIWIGQELSRPPEERIVQNGGLSCYLRLLCAALAPAACLTLALAGWTLLHWPKGQIVVGASSPGESWSTFLRFTFSKLNARILSPYLMKTFRHWRKALPWILITLTLLETCYIFARWRHWRYRPKTNRRALLCAYLGGVFVLTLLSHLLAFHYAGLLLPKDRTSIFFVPLCLMIVGAVAGFPHSDVLGKAMRWATVAILIVGSAYFVGCIRLHYFLLWRFDADMEPTYRKLVSVVGRGHETQVPCEYLYTSALNYYREYFHDDSFGWFWLWDAPDRAPSTHYQPYPLNSGVYVLMFPQDESFVAQQHLRIVYRGPVSDVVIAVRPK